ncbi:response regulator [Aquipseudomonas alcaligenes]|uniref:response regulator n=1 Tax=Aquipseudomonas alcaligenes TaxID=43263 RepID=UPI0035AF8E06
MLVEDNLVNQEMTVEILGRAGIRVDVANNGAQALAMLVQKAYDGVLMDCQMPVMDGFEATQRIRQLPGLAQLPILAMTANAMAGDRQRCLDAGMNEHIAKPLDVNQLSSPSIVGSRATVCSLRLRRRRP